MASPLKKNKKKVASNRCTVESFLKITFPTVETENEEKPDEEVEDEDESAFGGPKPMVPYSSMFILSTTNP